MDAKSNTLVTKPVETIKNDTTTTDLNDDTYENGEPKNRCIICKIDLGINNPRQYCAKRYCANSR